MARSPRKRKNPKIALFIIASLLLTTIAAGFLYRAISLREQQLKAALVKGETVQVVVATKELFQGNTIGQKQVMLKEIPPEFAPETVFYNLNEVLGRVPQERILPNEFIREERLADPEAGIGLNAIIPRGMRAVSIKISNGSAVSGFLNPGNFVDILITMKSDGQVTTTKTLMQSVSLLAVDNRMGNQSNDEKVKKPTVTLAVTPEEAQMITHGMREGDITLTLRNDIDVTHVTTHGAKNSNLIGTVENIKIEISEILIHAEPEAIEEIEEELAEEPVPVAKPKQESSLHIIRGGKKEQKTVGDDGQVNLGSQKR